MAEINAFLYAVHPKTTIKNVPYVGTIFRQGSYKLTKEAVEVCLKYGSVYRRFATDHSEKVNTYNIDRLHNPYYISEEDWNKPRENDEPVEDNGTTLEDKAPVVEDNTNEAIINEPTVPENTEPEPVEEPKEETPTDEEPTIDKTDNNSDVENESIEEPATTEETKEETTIIDPLADYENNEEDNNTANEKKLNINYNGKKKHNK